APPPNRRGYPPPKANPRVFTHPETGEVLAPKALGGPELPLKNGEDVRAALFEGMRAPDNPFFPRRFANRVSSPYSALCLAPPNPGLLAALAREFVEQHYDIRPLERVVLNSRTYHQSAAPNATNTFDKNNFARSYLRPMMAEVVVDVLNAALGVSETYGPND